MMNPTQPPPQAQMMQFILGKWISKPIHAVARLGIADLLADGPMHIDELAEKSDSHAPSLYRVMRALAGLGIFSEKEDRLFELTPMAECLKSGALRSAALMFHSRWHDNAWDNLLHGVQTGDIPFDHAHGKPVMEWLGEHPGASGVYNRANAVKAMTSHRAIVEAYDFSGISVLTDVGGGYGTLMAEILIAHPGMKGVIADLPAVVQGAEEEIRKRGLESRCRATACDFFKEIPAGSDAYLMSHILHDWDDEQAIQILKNCRRTMSAGSKLLIVETVIPPGNEFSIAKLLDLEMFVIGSGRERTDSEFRNLFGSGGFTLSRIVPTEESISVIEGIRI
jgi:hypothetical protein